MRDVGKTFDDAVSEISRSINMIEAALSCTSYILGYHFNNEATETHTINEPLGVCLAVTPFNFPLMIPMWIIPFAIAAGNTLVLKPSEQAPSVVSILGELFQKADFPPGVFNIVHGGPSTVDKLLSEPSIKAVSFVGSDEAGSHIHNIATAARMRVQANCGQKNHGVVMPDANKLQALYALAASAFGAAGQRCMGLSAAVFVGESIDWLPELVTIASQLRVGAGSQPGIALGPLISRAAKDGVEGMIQGAVEDGAMILLDGRGVVVPDYPQGNFVGPTIISDVETHMECYQKEILGPVLVCLHVETIDEAIELVNDNRCRGKSVGYWRQMKLLMKVWHRWQRVLHFHLEREELADIPERGQRRPHRHQRPIDRSVPLYFSRLGSVCSAFGAISTVISSRHDTTDRQ